jgi:hypothetical protein
MKDPTKIHPLAEKGAKSGQIRFIHPSDGKEHTFNSVINKLTGSRMTYFDKEAPTVDDPMSWVNTMFRNIRKKAKVLEVIGDF